MWIGASPVAALRADPCAALRRSFANQVDSGCQASVADLERCRAISRLACRTDDEQIVAGLRQVVQAERVDSAFLLGGLIGQIHRDSAAGRHHRNVLAFSRSEPKRLPFRLSLEGERYRSGFRASCKRNPFRLFGERGEARFAGNEVGWIIGVFVGLVILAVKRDSQDLTVRRLGERPNCTMSLRSRDARRCVARECNGQGVFAARSAEIENLRLLSVAA